MLFMMVTGVPPFTKANYYTDAYYKEFCDNNTLFWKRVELRKINRSQKLSTEFKVLIYHMLQK
jgi:hypothetical protein